jgi:hypothetical protein
MIEDPDPNLPQVVLALSSPPRLARRLHGRNQQCDENTDDRDDDQ